jgi:hypothetical protein|tara:strand:+ start:362 stop:493 length:132 start_codon:yes stop_codon:yes gene_type:complete
MPGHYFKNMETLLIIIIGIISILSVAGNIYFAWAALSGIRKKK